MEKNMTEMRSARLRATSLAQVEGLALTAPMCTSETSGLLAVHTAGAGASFSGTRVSTVAPATSAYKATALLPISDVVVFDGAAGLRSWRPPV